MFSIFKKKSPDMTNAERIPLSALIKLMAQNDTLEIELLIEGKVVKIGVSSDYDHRRTPEYFDKRYYLDEEEYLTSDEFSRSFAALTTETIVTVLRIDSVAPKHYKFDR